jgi:GTPase SAR1 family protein
MKHFKIIVVGSPASGKSTYLKRLATGEYTDRHIPTIINEKTFIFFGLPNGGTITFEVWEMQYVQNTIYLADGIIAFYDVSNSQSLQVALSIVETHSNIIPIMLCGNKTDCIKHTRVQNFNRSVHTCQLSAKTTLNYAYPFIYLSKILLHDENIQLTLNLKRLLNEQGTE